MHVVARRVHVLTLCVTELDADVGFVWRFVAAEARIAKYPHQRAAHLFRDRFELGRKSVEVRTHRNDEIERRFAHE